MPTIVRENHDNLNATLILSIPVTDYKSAFQAKLNEFRKTAHLKGFRKGKTPVSIIRKMYGRSALVDLINKMLGEEVDKYIREEKIDLLVHPIPSEDQKSHEFDTKDLEDFQFKFDLGIAPGFEVTGLDDHVFNYYKTIIPDSMVEADLADARKRLGKQESMDDEVQAEDIIKIQAEELENGLIKENGFTNEFSVSYSQMTEEAKEIFKGKKKGDLVQFDIFNLEKDKEEAFIRKYFLDVNEDAAEQPEINKEFQAVITDVTRLVHAELNQAFFDKYFGEGIVNSEAEVKDELKERIKSYYDRQADSFLFRDIKEHLETTNKLDFPEAFLKRWMVASGNLPKDASVEEEIGNLTGRLTWSLIRNKLAKRFDVSVSEKEVKQNFRMQLNSIFSGQDYESVLDDYIEKMMKDEQQYNNVSNQVLSAKLFTSMKEVVTLNENEITTADFEKVIAEEKVKNQPPAPESVLEAAEEVEVEDTGIEEAEVVEE